MIGRRSLREEAPPIQQEIKGKEEEKEVIKDGGEETQTKETEVLTGEGEKEVEDDGDI